MAVQSAFAGGALRVMPGRARALLLAGLVAAVCAPARAARANGAFPDSLQILLPADRPHQIVLTTNFGLIISDDDGATWTWTCEQKEIINGGLYAVGPSPGNRFFGLSTLAGLAYSDDDSCTWQQAAGTLTTNLAKDFFPDPGDASHVFAIASASVDGAASYRVLESRDGGMTFGPALYTAPTGGTLLGVENALSDPRIIYLALYTTTTTSPSTHPALVRSTDGGLAWTTVDLETALGPAKFRIIGVDPVDPLTIYLRVIDLNVESVMVSKDGGTTFKEVLAVGSGVISAFARLASGTVLVGAIAGPHALGFRSTDGGATFVPWAPVPHLRALAERAGQLYAAAKNYTDGWAIGVSDDEGGSFRPLVRYDQVRAIRPCAQAACEESCDYQASSGIWLPGVCRPGVDGGSPDRAAPEPPDSGEGCGCAAAGGGSRSGRVAALALAALGALATRARRRRS